MPSWEVTLQQECNRSTNCPEQGTPAHGTPLPALSLLVGFGRFWVVKGWYRVRVRWRNISLFEKEVAGKREVGGKGHAQD